MKRSVIRFLTAGFSALLLFSAVNAQDRTLAAAAGDKYVISAKAGGVNFVEGSVSVLRETGRSGVLLKGDMLGIGDRVATQTNGKAEILLTPGSYVRLGGNSDFQFKDTSLDDLRLDLARGSAIFEVFAEDEYPVTVTTPNDKFSLIRTGVYRIDVNADGNASIEVWKGRAKVEGVADTIKGGREVTADGVVAKFDRGDRDSLEQWSRERSKELAKITSKLKRDNLRQPLINSFMDRRWNFYNSFGLWVYDASWGNYCFLPFGYGWNSPYGYGFGRSIWYYRLPRVIYNTPPPVHTNPGTDPRGSRDSAAVRMRDQQTARPRAPQAPRTDKRPPFQTIDRGGTIARPQNDDVRPAPRRPIFIPAAPAPATGARTKP